MKKKIHHHLILSMGQKFQKIKFKVKIPVLKNVLKASIESTTNKFPSSKFYLMTTFHRAIVILSHKTRISVTPSLISCSKQYSKEGNHQKWVQLRTLIIRVLRWLRLSNKTKWSLSYQNSAPVQGNKKIVTKRRTPYFHPSTV